MFVFPITEQVHATGLQKIALWAQSKTARPRGVFQILSDPMKVGLDTFRLSEDVFHTSGETAYFSTFHYPD